MRYVFYNSVKKPLIYAALLALLNLSLPRLNAVPAGGAFQNGGSGTITYTQNSAQVTPAQAKSVINWQSIDTSNGEFFNFNNGGLPSSAVLNRVISGSPTRFAGQLNAASGMKIFFINTAGFIFTNGATINAPTFLASSLDPLSDTDLLNGIYSFQGPGAPIDLSGNIYLNGQSAVFLGSQINSSAVIHAQAQGWVVLAAGDQIFFNNNGAGISVQSSSPNINKIDNQGQINSGNIVLAAGDIYSQALNGVTSLAASATNDIRINGNVYANTDITLTADADSDSTGLIEILASDIFAGNGLTLNGKTELTRSGPQQLKALAGSGGKLTINGDIKKTQQGTLTLAGDNDIDINASIDAPNAGVKIQDSFHLAGDITAKTSIDAIAPGTLDGQGGQTLRVLDSENGVIRLYGSYVTRTSIRKTGAGNLTIAAGPVPGQSQGPDPQINLAQTVRVDQGDLIIEDAFRAGGDLIAENLMLSHNAVLDGVLAQGPRHQSLVATAGNIVAESSVTKTTSGNLIKLAQNDIELNGPVSALAGGVSLTAQNGKIFTGNAVPDSLDVAVSGVSDPDFAPGVELPFGQGRAAVVLQSGQTLKLSSQASINASGSYDPQIYDDRPGVNFLSDPQVIGPAQRDPGQPADVSVYLASTNGDVEISAFTTSPQGSTIVLDALENVLIGSVFRAAILSSQAGSSTQTVSRLSEWKQDAQGRVPYVNEPFPSLPEGYSYVTRGAGMQNPVIEDHRAWVLQDQPGPGPQPQPGPEPQQDPDPEPPIVYPQTAQAQQADIQSGLNCEDAMNWLAAEIGTQQVKTYLNFAFIGTTDIRPCETCEKMFQAASILADNQQIYIPALSDILSDQIDNAAPMTPESAQRLSSRIAQIARENPKYASAKQWLDSLDRYVSLLHNEIGFSMQDAGALALAKYVPDDDNYPAVAAYARTALDFMVR